MPLQVPVTQTGLEASIEAAAKKAGRNLQINLGTNAKSINSLSQPLGRITGQADEFTKSMEAANARVFAFGASVGIINGVSKAFGALVKSTIEVEKSLVEINSVLGASSDSLQKFGNKLFDVAKTTGQTFDVVAKGALELARQGLSTEETLKRINDALILSRLSGLDAQQSVEGLTAAFNSFKETGITTSQILNKLVVVSQKYSVSERDLIEGLKRSASVADQAGVSFDELVGIITTVQERTARGGAVIGNAFKTIFARIQDTGALQDLSNLGIQVTDLEGKILPATKILQNLGAEFNNLSQLEQADIAKKLGGVYQLSNLLAAVKDLSSEQSKYNDIVKLSAGATNEAYQKNAALNETLAALINKVSVSAQQLGATLGAIGITDNLKSLLGFFNNILEGIQNILGEESMLGDMFRGLAKGIGSVLAGPGLALFGAIVAKLSKDLISFGLESLKSFFKIGQASKEINALQGSIASTLLRNKDIQAQILSLEGNRVAQAKFFTTALNEQYLTMQKMQGIAASIAPAVYGGTRGGRGGTSKNAAGGYMPAVSQESRDISRGVGGARGGDKPVVIPNFAFGGGKKGTMVAHTGEFIVPNFAAGGSAIFNRDMVRSMGLPAGAQKIGAAGGFIPNFANIATETSRSNLNSIIANKSGRKSPQEVAAAKKRLAELQQAKEKSRLVLDASKFALLIPTIGENNQDGQNFSGSFKKGSSSIAYELKNLKIRGPQVPKAIDQAADPNDEYLKNNIQNSIADDSAKYANLLGKPAKKITKVDVLRLFETNKGTKGAISSAVGAGFEAATMAAIKTSNFKEDRISKLNQKGGDFDVRGASSDINTLFGLRGIRTMDFKSSRSPGNIDSFAKKLYNELPAALSAKVSKAASGFIPNFADPLKEAIDREMSAGVPASQIYIDKNSSLKNSMNPMGLMIANRRDEPAGGMQGINRARKEGANPMTYGAAGGFVPNYARDPVTGRFVKAPDASATSGGGADVEKPKRDLLGVIFAVQTGLSLLTGATADATGAFGKVTNVIGSIASSASTALLVFQGLQGLAKEGSKTAGILGKLGTYGAIAAGVYEGFKIFGSYQDANNAAINEASIALENLTLATSQATLNLNNLSPEQRKRTEKRGSELLQGAIRLGGYAGESYNAEFEGWTDKLKQNLQKAVNEGLGAGISYDAIFNIVNEAARSGMEVTADEAQNIIYKIKELQKISAIFKPETFIKENKLSAKSGVGQELYKIGQNDKRMQALMDLESPVKVGGPAVTDFLKNIGEKYNLDKAGQLRAVKLIIDALGEQLVVEEKINDEAEKSTTQTASLSLLKQQLENRIAYKNALFEATSAEEYTLELQKEMLSVGEKERTAAGYKLQALQDAKKLTLEQEKATLDVLKNSELINKKLESAGISGQIDPTKFKEIAGISEEISDLIKQQGGYTKEVENRAQSLLEPIVKNKEQQDLIISLLKETNGEISKRLALENKINALNNLRAAQIEASKFVNEKQTAAITNEYDQQLKLNELKKRGYDIDLETFKIQSERKKIGGSAGSSFAIDRKIKEQEQLTLKVKFDLDQQDLLIQVKKTLAEAALSAGLSTQEVKDLNLNQVTTPEQAKEKAKEIAAIEGEAEIKKLLTAQAQFEKSAAASDYFKNQVVFAADEFAKRIVGIIPGDLQGKTPGALAGPEEVSKYVGQGNIPVGDGMLPPTIVEADEDFRKKTKSETEAQVAAIRAGIAQGSALGDTIANMFAEGPLAAEEYKNKLAELDNAFASSGASLTTFNNLVRGVFTNLSENIAQNQFAMLSATDSQSIIGNAVEARKNAILAQGPSDKGTIIAAADSTAIYEKELEIKRAITAEDKINGEFELEKLKEILPLRMELLKAETNSEREAIIDRIIAKEKQRLPVLDRIKAAFSSTTEQRTAELEDSIVNASIQFKDNLVDGISQAIEGGESLKDILLNTALEFTREITKASIKNAIGSIGNLFNFGGSGGVTTAASGGMINGGSGTKDDVPAMLMGGEYVVKKKAVQKYGPDFLNAINNGTLGGYAKGGSVKKPTQTGEGGYFLPGLYGNESISGSDALMSFATQNYTSGARDIISSGSNFASIDLEQESIRLSQRGRTNSPLFAATQSAKEQALGMVFEQVSREEAYKKAIEEAKKQEKARQKAIRKQLLISSAMAIGSAVAGPLLGAAGAGAKAAFGASKAAGGTLFTNLGAAAKGVFTGGQIGGLTQNVGGLNNLFKSLGQGLSGNFAEAGNLFKLSQIGSTQQLQSAYLNSVNSKTGFSGFLTDSGYIPKAPMVNQVGTNGVGGNWFSRLIGGFRNPFGTGSNKNNQGFEATGQDVQPSLWERLTGRRNTIDPYQLMSEDEMAELRNDPVYGYMYRGAQDPRTWSRKRATGGTIPETSGIDTVPTMLSGGEFVMNRAAAQNIGAGNLQALNAGASSLPTEEKTEELNDKLISKLDELIQANSSKSSVGAININVDGSGKSNESNSGGQAGTANQQLARNIRDMVVKVIQDEQRLGGLLR